MKRNNKNQIFRNDDGKIIYHCLQPRFYWWSQKIQFMLRYQIFEKEISSCDNSEQSEILEAINDFVGSATKPQLKILGTLYTKRVRRLDKRRQNRNEILSKLSSLKTPQNENIIKQIKAFILDYETGY